MLKLLIALTGILVFWSVMIGWSIMYGFADRSYASNVSAIVLAPFLLVPMPGILVLNAVIFWCLVSVLAIFRHFAACRVAAFSLLVVHWLGATITLARDLLSDGGWNRFVAAFSEYPSLCLFVVAYGFTQYYLCKRLASRGDEAEQLGSGTADVQLPVGRPWRW